MSNEVFRTTMNEIKTAFRAIRNGSSSFKNATNASLARSYANDTMAGYLESGYTPEKTPFFDTSTLPVRKKKRSRYNDCEGDFRYDLYTAGDENCFVEWSQRESIPGLHLQFFFGFTASVSGAVIDCYTDWLLGAFTTLESSGVDCSISAFSRGERRYGKTGEYTEWHIEVKREGERNDFTEWSALFAPNSYRTLGFFTTCMSAEFNNRTASSGMGRSAGPNWSVKFDTEKRVIEISADSDASSFPEQRMTEELEAAIAASRVG